MCHIPDFLFKIQKDGNLLNFMKIMFLTKWWEFLHSVTFHGYAQCGLSELVTIRREEINLKN
jgi:hypothetical protein